MYYEYFGLKQPPFKITPDTNLFSPSGNRGAVLEALVYAVSRGEGIVKVVGEVGTGKTMLCRMLEIELPENVEVVYLANPSLSPEDILHAIAFELHLKVSETDNRLKVMNVLQNYLLERHADNRQVVVFVEEAQVMPIATLEEIRLLSNLETNQNKLLQIVLFGQLELDEKIAQKEIRQLKERITYSFKLDPLEADEIRDYLNSRMMACGCRSTDIFSSAAVGEIVQYSQGLLRRVNILADKALLAAYAGNKHKVASSHVRIAARDSEFLKNRTLSASAIMVPVVILIFIVLIAGFFFPIKKSHRIEAVQKTTNAQIARTVGVTRDEQVERKYLSKQNEGLAVAVKEDVGQSAVTSGAMSESLNVSTLAPSQETTPPIKEEDELPERLAVGMTEQEFGRFRQQLHELLPEVNLELNLEGVCEQCSSIIYRPVM